MCSHRYEEVVGGLVSDYEPQLRRVVSIDNVPGNDLADRRDEDPTAVCETKEPWSEAMVAPSEKMRRVALACSKGDAWQEIANREGASADAIRVKLRREVSRLAQTLN